MPIISSGQSIGGGGAGPQEGRLKRELSGIGGFFAGIPKGIVALAKNPKLIAKLPGEVIKSFGRTVSGGNIRKAIGGETTFSEALLEDLSNVATVATLGAAGAAKLGGSARLVSGLQKVGTPTRSLFQAAVKKPAKAALLAKRGEDAGMLGELAAKVPGAAKVGGFLEQREVFRRPMLEAKKSATAPTAEIRRELGAIERKRRKELKAAFKSGAITQEAYAKHLQEIPDVARASREILVRQGAPVPDNLDEVAEATGQRIAGQTNIRDPKTRVGKALFAPSRFRPEVEGYIAVVENIVGQKARASMIDDLARQGVVRLDETPGFVAIDMSEIKAPGARGLGISEQLPASAKTKPTQLTAPGKRTKQATKVYVPEAVAKTIKQWNKVQDISDLIPGYKAFADNFRGAVLYHSPRWLTNNLFGNFALAALAIGPNPVEFARAWKYAWGQARKEVPFGGTPGKLGIGSGSEAPVAAKGLARTRFAEMSKKVNEVTDGFARTMVYGAEVRKGAKAAGLDPDAVFAAAEKGIPLEGAQLQVVEDAIKSAHKQLVDYGDLSPIEQNVVRNIVPFYTWQKGILKLALSLPADHPLRFAALEKISEVFGGFSREERETLPDYLVPSVELPGLGRVSTRAANPFQDSLSLIRPDNLINNLNPLFGAGVKFVARKAGTPFGPKEVGQGGFLEDQVGVEDLGTQFLRDLPQVNVARQLLGSNVPGAEILGAPTAQTGAGAALGMFGITQRTPEQISKAQTRLAKSKAAALQSQQKEREFQQRRRLGLSSAQQGKRKQVTLGGQ